MGASILAMKLNTAEGLPMGYQQALKFVLHPAFAFYSPPIVWYRDMNVTVWFESSRLKLSNWLFSLSKVGRALVILTLKTSTYY